MIVKIETMVDGNNGGWRGWMETMDRNNGGWKVMMDGNNSGWKW